MMDIEADEASARLAQTGQIRVRVPAHGSIHKSLQVQIKYLQGNSKDGRGSYSLNTAQN